MCLAKYVSVNDIIWLMESVFWDPKVFLLRGTHCMKQKFWSKTIRLKNIKACKNMRYFKPLCDNEVVFLRLNKIWYHWPNDFINCDYIKRFPMYKKFWFYCCYCKKIWTFKLPFEEATSHIFIPFDVFRFWCSNLTTLYCYDE